MVAVRVLGRPVPSNVVVAVEITQKVVETEKPYCECFILLIVVVVVVVVVSLQVSTRDGLFAAAAALAVVVLVVLAGSCRQHVRQLERLLS